MTTVPRHRAKEGGRARKELQILLSSQLMSDRRTLLYETHASASQRTNFPILIFDPSGEGSRVISALPLLVTSLGVGMKLGAYRRQVDPACGEGRLDAYAVSRSIAIGKVEVRFGSTYFIRHALHDGLKEGSLRNRMLRSRLSTGARWRLSVLCGEGRRGVHPAQSTAKTYRSIGYLSQVRRKTPGSFVCGEGRRGLPGLLDCMFLEETPFIPLGSRVLGREDAPSLTLILVLVLGKLAAFVASLRSFPPYRPTESPSLCDVTKGPKNSKNSKDLKLEALCSSPTLTRAQSQMKNATGTACRRRNERLMSAKLRAMNDCINIVKVHEMRWSAWASNQELELDSNSIAPPSIERRPVVIVFVEDPPFLVTDLRWSAFEVKVKVKILVAVGRPGGLASDLGIRGSGPSGVIRVDINRE
ncbi:hypothetical protein SCHPADRAFT_894257 [Schizopora paradoxa]|uniref:Uncharacterized protein n=1 Tax=Schizopora paradoxa TaxID=27342 RepID=A0A0H2RSZ0_9AGAM|nr:hypothetical protein SCHPADRAFT_894257 [Schizopora paradoxa]